MATNIGANYFMSTFIQEYFYLLAACMGALCVYEAKLLLKTQDFIVLDKRLLWSTSIEFFWFVICLIGIFSWELSDWKLVSCLLFIINYLFACVYTWYLFRQIDYTQENFLNQFRIPRWYLEYYFSFGALYGLMNVLWHL